MRLLYMKFLLFEIKYLQQFEKKKKIRPPPPKTALAISTHSLYIRFLIKNKKIIF